MMMVAALEQEPMNRATGSILVVDDDPGVREVVVEMLAIQGYRTRTARDGLEALEAIEEERPSLVLLDMRMPRMDGWDFSEALAERGIHIPVIVMTAAQDARGWAEEVGATAWLGKPFRMDALTGAVARVLDEAG